METNQNHSAKSHSAEALKRVEVPAFSPPTSLSPPTPEQVAKILSFEAIESLAQFYECVGWTPAMELQLLIDIIRTTDNETTRLRALRDLQTRRAEILRSSGLVVKATKTQKLPDGSRTILSADIIAQVLGFDTPDAPNNKEENKEISNGQNETKQTPPIPTEESERGVTQNAEGCPPDSQPVPAGGPADASHDNSAGTPEDSEGSPGEASTNNDEPDSSRRKISDGPIVKSSPPTGETLLRGIANPPTPVE